MTRFIQLLFLGLVISTVVPDVRSGRTYTISALELLASATFVQNALDMDTTWKKGNEELELDGEHKSGQSINLLGLDVDDDDDEPHDKDGNHKASKGAVWGYAVLCVSIINACSLLGAFVTPIMNRPFYKYLLNVLFGLGVGACIGSGLFHLLPQAFELDAIDHERKYLYPSLVIFGGIWMFFMVERVLKLAIDYKERTDKEKQARVEQAKIDSSLRQVNSVSTIPVDNNIPVLPIITMGRPSCCDDIYSGKHHRPSNIVLYDPQQTLDSLQEWPEKDQPETPSFGGLERQRLSGVSSTMFDFGPNLQSPRRRSSTPTRSIRSPSLRQSPAFLDKVDETGHTNSQSEINPVEEEEKPKIATVAWMITFGDGFHNIFDGLAIGAAFNKDILTGVSLSIAILCQELPHELGDFAILINSGMSIRQAIKYNFLSASTCYIGLICGILLGDIDATEYIFALAAGTLLYLGLVDMLPAMNELADETSKTSAKKALIFIMLQNVGIFCGISALFLLARFEDNLDF